MFFVGLGCLLFVFVSIARRLRDNITTSVYFRSKRSARPWILSGVGVVLIAIAQGFYWFNSEVDRFIPFKTDTPQAQVSFLYEEYKQPRLILQATDQNNLKTSQMVPFTADSVALGIEIVHWKKVCQVLGLKDCYRINGVYYLSGAGDTILTNSRTPNHELNGGPSGFVSLVQSIGSAFPGDLKLYFSQPIVTDGNSSYLTQISHDAVTTTRMIDKPTAVNYPH
jgi:hypothetical protein